MPGSVAHVHEWGEGLGGVRHGHAHIHPAQARALRQRVLCHQKQELGFESHPAHPPTLRELCVCISLCKHATHKKVPSHEFEVVHAWCC